MNAKKWTSILCAAALTLSLAACGAQTAGTSESQGTLTGQVTEVDGSQVTLLLGTLNENENGSGTAPDGTPDGDPGQGGQAGTPPEKPAGSTDSGSTNSQPPAKPDGGSTGSGGTPPEMPSGGQPSGAAPSGNAPQGEPPARPGSSFTAGNGSVTLDFSKAEITENGENVGLEDIEVGDVLTVAVGTTNASGLTVTTSGNSSAAIRSDRGGGTSALAAKGSSFSIQDSSGSTVYSGTALCSANYVFFSSSKLSAAAPSPTSPLAATMRRPPRGRQPTGSSAAMAMGALPPARP